ncbi:MAG: aminopeptidase P family protein [Bacteroidales bacterium]|nr:aminopeptidase P family protein [Bacteroidales bacterium]
MPDSAQKLTALRNSMKENNIDAYVIPNSDPHLGEYIPDFWCINRWLTGFTGSASTVVVTQSFAGLWTDSRYFIQAEKQLTGSGFELMKIIPAEKKDSLEWLVDNLVSGEKAGLNGRTFSIGRLRKLEGLAKEKNIIIETECDLISDIWTDRPAVSGSPAFDHPVAFCGKERSVKIDEVRAEMNRLKLDYHLLTSADDIMWLLNIRGNDLKYSPLLLSFAIIDDTQILLFVDENKIPFKLAREFDSLGIILLPYEEIAGMLSTLNAECSILLTPSTTSAELFNAVPRGMKVREDISIPSRMKAVKNKGEIESIGRVMIKDGVALTRFFFWIEHNLDSVPMSELSLSEKLTHFRSEQENYLGASFSSIVAYKEHGALPHYSATSETDSVIGSDGILLVDSGGQYLDGTTDITRTIVFGRPAERQKRDFTLVLKGTISLAMAKFPAGTKGSQLDILARKALWEQGLNFGHGTGHGVGFCLNVHEGPQSISPAATDQKTIIEAGMLTSDEPAIYREGEYGIRIENLILCNEDEETEFGKFLRFETVSLCYIDKNLIDFSLLDKRELEWLNSYHSEVYEKLSPYLSKEEKEWLREKTSQI